MKQLHVWITDDQAKVLDGFPNKAEIVRNALDMYNGGITTDTLAGLREAFIRLESGNREIEVRIDALTKLIDEIAQS